LCIINALMSEIEYERIGIDTAVYAWTHTILEHKRNIIGSIFQKNDWVYKDAYYI
jgi:hypothetical protein